MTASPALLTKELESALAKLRALASWEPVPEDTATVHPDEAAALLQRIAALEQRVKAMERHVVLALASAQGGLVHAQRCYPNLAGDFDLIAVRLNLALDRPKEPQ